VNKRELIGEISRETGVNREDAGIVVETMLRQIGDVIARGEEVRLVGFGAFSIGRRKASSGRNPRTGEPISVASVTQPKFRPGSNLKERVS
jgi:DNA-binding protein HU-beta